MDMKKLFEIFKHPGTEFRGKPFWAWNGKLEPQELRRQIRIMHAMGLGGFFMHSRVGLEYSCRVCRKSQRDNGNLREKHSKRRRNGSTMGSEEKIKSNASAGYACL